MEGLPADHISSYVAERSSCFAGLNPSAKVEVLYPAKAILGEGPFYEDETDTLLWVDIDKKTINFFDLKTSQNR